MKKKQQKIGTCELYSLSNILNSAFPIVGSNSKLLEIDKFGTGLSHAGALPAVREIREYANRVKARVDFALWSWLISLNTQSLLIV